MTPENRRIQQQERLRLRREAQAKKVAQGPVNHSARWSS